jgi:uncharacterized protein (DUF736 family)
MSENKINTGAIFKNTKKTTAMQPDYRGVINCDGKEKEIALWLKESKSGMKYFSVSLSDPFQKPGETPQAPAESPFKEQEDDLPF